MATSIFGLQLSNASDESFRAWGSALSAQIGAMLTRVVQSDDVNWATAVKPASGNTFTSFEVFRFNDPLQSTHPIFVKIGYGASAAASIPGIQLTVGKSADGAGNIGGTLISAVSTIALQGELAVTQNCYISSGASWFALSLAPAVSYMGGMLVIERAVSSGGAPIGDALIVGWQGAASVTHEYRMIDYTNAVAESVSSGLVAIPLPLATDRSIANGTTAPVFPAACMSPAGVFWRPRVILGTARQNAGLGEVINGLLDGNGYLSLGAGSQKSDQRNSAYATTMIRWD